MLRHSAATGVATGKIGSKQRQRPIQKHAGKSSIDRKTAPHLSERRNLLICDAHNCERVVKTFQTSLRKNKELRTASDFSPSMLLYGTQSLFRTNFPCCHALLGFLTSSLASPMSLCRRDQRLPRYCHLHFGGSACECDSVRHCHILGFTSSCNHNSTSSALVQIASVKSDGLVTFDPRSPE